MIFHVARDGQPLGTFTQEEIRDHLEAGRLLVTDIVWSRGMEDWEALAQVFDVEIIHDEDAMPELPPGLPPAIPGTTTLAPAESWTASPRLPDPQRTDSEPETSGWAIASLILGIVSLGGMCFTGVPAIVCGHSALKDIRRSKGRVTGFGFAKTGLALGYAMCVLSVLGAAVWLGMGAVNKVEAHSMETDAIRDSRMIMIALKVYAADNGGKYPADLQILVDQGLLTSDKPLNTIVPGWVGKPGWKYTGAGLGPEDHISKIILETRARNLEGKGIQVTNDQKATIVKIEDGPVK